MWFALIRHDRLSLRDFSLSQIDFRAKREYNVYI